MIQPDEIISFSSEDVCTSFLFEDLREFQITVKLPEYNSLTDYAPDYMSLSVCMDIRTKDGDNLYLKKMDIQSIIDMLELINAD
jgi:hypothetical protein